MTPSLRGGSRWGRIVPGGAALGGLLLAASAFAQDAADLRPPAPEEINAPPGIFSIVVVVLLTGLLLLAALLPSKRGHQD